MVFICGTKVSDSYGFLHLTVTAGKPQNLVTAWKHTQVSSIANI